MDGRLEDLARQLAARSFLYDDPESFKAGIREALRALQDTSPSREARATA